MADCIYGGNPVVQDDKLYIPEKTFEGLAVCILCITFDFAIDTKWSTGVWFNNDFVKGQWVNVTCKMSSSKAGDSGIIIRATNEKSSSALNFYFDDISLTKIEKRP